MKILEMRLIAYGPFTDVTLDLSGGKEGFHVIYGPNEAGKSSALRALRHLFYGIPIQSADDFLHPYARMRIGATIQAKNGDRLVFIRRKGNVKTLRAPDDQAVVEDAALRRFLNGVDADLFETMFGIGYPDLVRGGREIVQGGGSLGQLIFAAGSGVANLREIQNELESEANALFLPSGHKPKINDTLSCIKKSRKEMHEAALPGQEWENHHQALEQAAARLKDVENDLKKKQRALHRLGRVQDALPVIARRRVLLDEHKTYATATILPEDFAEKRRELLTKLGVSTGEQDQSRKNIEIVEKAISELQVSDRILESAEMIEAVYQELGTRRNATEDRIKLEVRKESLRGEAKEILHSLREDLTVADAERLRIKKTDAVRIQELGIGYERIGARIETAREAVPRLEQRITRLGEALSRLGPSVQVEDLIRAVEQAEVHVADEKHCGAELSDIQTATKTLMIKLSRQRFWSGSIQELESLPVPSLETINLFEEQHSEADRNCRRIKEEHDRLTHALNDLERQIEQLRLQQEVPTEADLQKARGIRDRGWRLVSDTIAGHIPADAEVDSYIRESQLTGTLAEAFETSLHQSDQIADRLRREADRVATKAKLIADQTAFEKQLRSLKTERDEAEKARVGLDEKWRNLWEPSGILPGGPKEMQPWIQGHNNMADKAAESREKQAKVDTKKAEIEKHVKTLERILRNITGAPNENCRTLVDRVKRARHLIEKEDKRRTNQEQLEKEKTQQVQELADARIKVESSEKDLARWQKEWEEAVRPLGLDGDAIPPQANAVMNALKDLFDKLKEANILQKRIEGIDRDAAQFEKQVAGLAKAVAEDLKDLPAEEATAELNRRLTRARTTESKRQTLQDQLTGERSRLDRSTRGCTQTQSQLQSMCKEAGCLTHDELQEAEKRSGKRVKIESDLSNLDERLLDLSGGATIDDFIAETSQFDPDGIDGDIASLNEAIETLNQEKADLNQTLGQERNELDKMDGSARAAEMAEDIQIQMGRLEHDVEQYARLKIASSVLNQAIERFRKKNQGPIITRAADLFKQITGNAFEGVRADSDDRGKPLLVGVRTNSGEIVTVDGMSDGTADQLYLALRLAGLEEYLDKNETMPFIVDDILIKFDDARATATLKALAGLSTKTQVIFFTHHQHLVELAESNCDHSLLVKHSLGD